MRINAFVRGAAGVLLGASASLALTAPAWATGSGHDPVGANGTVKIDDVPFDPKIHNEPHVTCEFRVKFFNFDANERGNIIFTAQPPSGQGQVLLRQDDMLFSNDAAGGGNPDPDEIYTYKSTDLNLTGLKMHDKQGYHIKLTIDQPSAPGKAKHKVFWLKPCESSTPPSTPPVTPPSTPPGTPPSTPPGTPPSTTPGTPPTSPGSPGGTPPTSSAPGMVGVGNESESGGGLAVTGAAASTAAAVGLGLVGVGAALMIRRRRRFTA